MSICFGNISVDLDAFKLRRDGQELALQPKVFDVLRYLIIHRDRVVTKSELLDAVWKSEDVNESAVPWTISHVREALGQKRGSKEPIETIHGRGYRFVSDVEPSAGNEQPLRQPPASKASHPFVGRAEIMDRLVSKLRDAADGCGHMCLISGEAGIGKTRSAQELIEPANQLGFSVWLGRAIEEPGMPSFWPLTQILREAVHARPNLRAVGQRLLARLVSCEPGASTPHDAPSEAPQDLVTGRFWLQQEVCQLLLTAARTKPLLLIIDDLQWADAGTLNLLGFLAPELSKTRILIVAMQRDDRAGAEACRPAGLARYAERFRLARLTPADIGNYIAQLTAFAEPALPLSLAIHRATTGNPLFVQETVRALISKHGAHALHSLAPDAVKVPEVARDVLRVRLQGLGPELRDLLARASVLGESFELPILQLLCDGAVETWLGLIEEAMRHGLLIAETPQRYRFSHALLRSLSYDEISTDQRVALHRKAGEVLEALQSVEPRYGEIAHHLYRSLPAGAHGRVVAAATLAARAAERVLAYEDAARFYDWALEAQALDREAQPRERTELLLTYGRAQGHAGRRRDARNTLRRAIELARQHGYGDLLMRAARMLRPTFAMSRIPDTLLRSALDEILRCAQEGPNAQRILALSQLACQPPCSDDMQRSKRLSEEALQLARSFGEHSSLFEALRSRLYALSGPDDIEALLSVANELLELDRERPTVKSIEAHIGRVGAFMYAGDHAAAGEALQALGKTAHELRLPEAVWYYDMQMANRAYLQGDFAAAQAACPDLSTRSARLGLSYGKPFIMALNAVTGIELNGLEAFLTGFDKSSLAELGPTPPRYVRARFMRRSAERGRRDLALLTLDAFAAQGFETIPRDIGYLNTVANISMAVVLLGDLERAEQLYALLAPYPRHNTPDVLFFDDGSVSRYLALLAALLGRHAQVEEHFEIALAENRRMRRGSQVVWTCYDFARWLAEQPGKAAATRARALADEAHAGAQALGMTWLADKTRALEL